MGPIIVATGNVMSFFLAFVLLLEYCRLRFGRQGLGFFMLWLFILCVFPFILSIVLNNSTVARLSLLAPGISVLADPAGRWANFALLTVLAHFAIVALLLLFWYRQWRRVFTAAAGRGISH